MAIAKLDGQEAVETFKKMNDIIDSINERTTALAKTVTEVKEKTNMPFVGRISEIVSAMESSIKSCKENADSVLASLREYADQVDKIANGEDFD